MTRVFYSPRKVTVSGGSNPIWVWLLAIVAAIVWAGPTALAAFLADVAAAVLVAAVTGGITLAGAAIGGTWYLVHVLRRDGGGVLVHATPRRAVRAAPFPALPARQVRAIANRPAIPAHYEITDAVQQQRSKP